MGELLAQRTTLRLGGPAARFVEATTEDALVESVRAADETGEPLLLVAGGSNLVVADKGFPGTVLGIATVGDLLHHYPRDYLDARRPELMERFARQDVEWGLHGRD